MVAKKSTNESSRAGTPVAVATALKPLSQEGPIAPEYPVPVIGAHRIQIYLGMIMRFFVRGSVHDAAFASSDHCRFPELPSMQAAMLGCCLRRTMIEWMSALASAFSDEC